MKHTTFLACVGLLLSWSAAVGGAWGFGPFDNDDALDWVGELEESEGASILEDAFEDVTNSMFYIDAPECSRAIAAAEVVAALAGNPVADLPDAVTSWVRSSNLVVSEELIALAKEAVAQVRDSSKSELAELFRESGPIYEDWQASLSDLLKRLS